MFREIMADLIEVLAMRGYTTTFEPSLKQDRSIVLVTVKRFNESYTDMGVNSWKALQSAASQVPGSQEIFDSIN